MKRYTLPTLLAVAWLTLWQPFAVAAPSDYFSIRVVDDATGRGVPLVELSTVNSASWWTDSNGLIAFLEPGLMGQEVFFHVRSHGYEYPADFFKNRGVKLKTTPGAKAVIKVKRINIAERLYRITGQGIYRDTILLGQSPPTREPLLNGQVMGQDTVIVTPYRGRLYWFWGDTDRPSYPLGNFGASGATSALPTAGGLAPGVGVDLSYLVDGTGFSKPMCPKETFGEGLKWIEGVMTLPDETGRERLFARVAAGTGMQGTRDWRLGRFNDEKQGFEAIFRWDIQDSHDSSHPFHARVGAQEYIYLYANYRVPANLQSLTNLASYEAFTCLASGSRKDRIGASVDHDADGKVRYAWRAGADRLDGSRIRELLKRGLLKPGEAWQQFHDVETGRPIQLDRGSVCWNQFRRRWVMIASGSAGEIWFSEADTPVGPWIYARRVVVHEQYNFYNPTQHPFFDEEKGRIIYFEGTYTAAFSGAKQKTPRYDYNQIMYRLALDDPRLELPVPVYAFRQPQGGPRLTLRPEGNFEGAASQVEGIPFLAIPPGQPPGDLIPIWEKLENGQTRLARERPADRNAQPLFLAVSASARGRKDSAAKDPLVPLYEYHRLRDHRRTYSTQADLRDPEQQRSPDPLCLVWPNPMSVLILDANASAVPALPR